MEFGDKIKELRRQNKLTQEQFATKLTVTRQAASNWENNRNLPDLEMLILISTIFHLSLDELILGGNNMNHLTEKLINDSSKTKRAKYNMITALIGSLLLFLGFFCFFIKSTSVEYIDTAGILHENFYLLGLGYIFLFSGILVFLVTGISYLLAVVKKRS